MKISDFAPNADWDYTSDGLQILNASGGTDTFEYEDEEYDAIFTYFTKAKVKSCPADGWYHQDLVFDEGLWVSITDAGFGILPYGFAVVYETSSNDAGLVFSGEVSGDPQTIIAANDGWNLIGNPMPVFSSFADITANNDWDYTSDGLQILNSSGGTESFEYNDDEYDAIFSYFTKAKVKSCPADGWYHQDLVFDEGEWVSIEDAGWDGLAAGEAVVFETSSNTAGVQFPAAIKK